MGIGSCGGHWLRGLVDTVAGWWLWQSVGCMCLPAAIHGRNLLLALGSLGTCGSDVRQEGGRRDESR